MFAYFDCFSGISGDMTLGALLDLGVPLEWLEEQLRRVPLNEFDIVVSPVQRHGIQAASVQVKILDDKTSRNYSDIRDLIENSPLSDTVKSTSLAIFKKLAEAEARIHNCSVDHVHFHEVGGVDALVDIVGAALGLDYLGIKHIVASPIPLGKGFVTCSHGKLPVPAQATLGILTGVPVYGTPVRIPRVAGQGYRFMVRVSPMSWLPPPVPPSSAAWHNALSPCRKWSLTGSVTGQGSEISKIGRIF